MPFDGARLFGRLAGVVLVSWLCFLPFIGWWPAGCLTLLGIGLGLYYNLHFYNRLEQRDIDDIRNGLFK